MKIKSILKQQEVKRKKTGRFSAIWKIILVIISSFIKFSCLLVGMIIISLLFLSIYQYLLTSQYLKLEQVVIKGVDGEIKKELIKIARLDSGLSLLAINMNELKQRIERHEWIRSVTLEKQFPHTLIIRAEKERPKAIVTMGKNYYMDQGGKIFKEVNQTEDIDFPIITGVSDNVSERETQLIMAAQMMSVIESEKGQWSLKGLSEIHVGRDDHVSLYFCSLPAVIKLKGRELNNKMKELKKVVDHLSRTGRIQMLRGINLHYRDGVVVSFKETEVPKVS